MSLLKCRNFLLDPIQVQKKICRCTNENCPTFEFSTLTLFIPGRGMYHHLFQAANPFKSVQAQELTWIRFLKSLKFWPWRYKYAKSFRHWRFTNVVTLPTLIQWRFCCDAVLKIPLACLSKAAASCHFKWLHRTHNLLWHKSSYFLSPFSWSAEIKIHVNIIINVQQLFLKLPVN